MTATTDRAALYRSILERPEDDVVRRVFADYLRENGEIERADFIEVQLAISDHYARRPNSSSGMTTGMRHPMSVWRDELKELQRRERELWETVRCQFPEEFIREIDQTHKMAESINPNGKYSVATIRRGFVSAVRCRLVDWVGGDCPNCVVAGMYSRHRSPPCDRCGGSRTTSAHGPRIVAEQPVETLALSDCKPDPGSGDVWFFAEEWIAMMPDAVADEVDDLCWSESELAESFLGRALLNWARREAGLPPLREHATA